jgi:RNA polymerase sigma factor (TIGR02999 family)
MADETVTGLLARWSSGDREALDQLMPLVYNELRRIASNHLRHERAGHTLQTSAVVHEAYMKLVDQPNAHWRDRGHFYAVASQMIRRILVDHARGHNRLKRGAGAAPVDLDAALYIAPEKGRELIALDDALDALAQFDQQQCRVVELRFFGGLTVEEAADVLAISRATVNRDWMTARAWLMRELGSGASALA